jgi:thiol-disulfide isomerase/thioredoxin
MSTRLRTLLLSLALVAGSASAAPVQLSLPTLDGKTFDVEALRGQWIVVNYWATWCGPCIKEMREDVTVIGLAFEETTPEDLKSFIAERKVSYAIAAVDVYAPPAAFAVPKGLPTTHLIGPDGELKQSFLGPVTRADLERAIEAAE